MSTVPADPPKLYSAHEPVFPRRGNGKFRNLKWGILAGTLFVLPGFLSLMVLSIVYAEYGSVPLVAALLLGLKPAVLTQEVFARFHSRTC